MDVVFFYIDKPQRVTDVSDGRKNRDLVTTMIESARRFLPRARITQLSDATTSTVADGINIVRLGEPPEHLMPARMDYQHRFLRDWCALEEHVVFVDPDIIFQDGLEEAFSISFDIGLTWRDDLGQVSDAMPFNAGVVFARNNPRSQRFFKMATDILQAASDGMKEWWGDQLVMSGIVGRDKYQNRAADRIVSHDIEFQLFPCDEYNYSPPIHEIIQALSGEDTAGVVMSRLATKKVLHFKGGRKDSMVEYWKRSWS